MLLIIYPCTYVYIYIAKDSILMINRTSTTEAEEQILQRGQSMKSIASDVSGMSKHRFTITCTKKYSCTK